MRIVINGFGRIGRTVLRQILTDPQHEDIEVVGINDIAPLETCAYLFKYDSTFGPLPAKLETTDKGLVVNGLSIPATREADLSLLDLTGVDVVLECTGKVSARHIAERGLKAGARAVLIAGPSEHADVTAVMGANEDTIGKAQIVSNSSCTTNAIAPLFRMLDAGLGIERAHVTTIHCITGSQPMVDAPRGDLARSRAGGESMVPTTTSAAQELARILPEIGPRISVSAVRVPCLSVSAIDAVLQIDAPSDTSVVEFLRSLAAQSPVIGVTEDACVSRDLRARPESLILALPETIVSGPQVRIFGWYDNEWGFSARMIEMAALLAER
ncbi:type I glyceraldehyde-3-phosphate dehydrogenase [Falsihalocynthiibacter sp. S25ZX9]|uniref:type I glyceraldehyde-3-phosphate dehydrogenase n=1 Tax=Falsihalocynthiibacter sp. S25ZX9 TaxID=3240870 RepID=UPI00350FD49E